MMSLSYEQFVNHQYSLLFVLFASSNKMIFI